MTTPNQNWTVAIEFTDGVWTDLTSRVESFTSPISIKSGDTAESVGDTGGFAVVFRNHDQALTPENELSPYYPNILPNKRIRIQETILDQVIEHIGYLQFPDIDEWTESSETEPREQTITFSAVDRLTRIAGGRRFISVLTEHVLFNAGPAVKAFWPLREPAGPTVKTITGGDWDLTETVASHSGGYTANDPPFPANAYGSDPVAPADELTSIDFQPSRDTTGPAIVRSRPLAGTRSTGVTVNSGQVATLALWINPDQLLGVSSSQWAIQIQSDPGGAGTAFISFDNGVIGCAAAHGDWSGVITGPTTPYDKPTLVGMRFRVDPSPLIELWVDRDVYTGTMSVTTPTAPTFSTARIGYGIDGRIAAAQMYVGDESDWTHDHFLAQLNVGLYGHERQTSGERIRTLLSYAGVPGSDLNRIDDGVAVMQAAQLAGRNPVDAMTDAVETEQGLLFVTSNGIPVFKDRRRLLNI